MTSCSLTRIGGLLRVRVTGESHRSSYRSFAVSPRISLLSDRDRLALGLALVGMLGQLIMRETMAIAPSIRFEACFFHSVPIGRGSVTGGTTLWMRGPPPCPFAWGVRLAGSTP